MKKKTIDLLQFATLVIGAWFGIIPVIFKIVGNHTKGAFLPLYLPDPASMIVAGVVSVVSLVMIFALDKTKRNAT
ncbi:hypothetical protein BLA24_06035 [Streptomyces cinnamoneus]|uniref:Uncharacterized protein n=1 Tax=Streptomyces cinnamoneus TaxID=53446 RepID=A0A2G1XNA1_STRCJ|nr:hypothetical protein [Streptomyces cinnamoneus]PHQ52661.1 hypothetical protein BLA24_06035 [Streptomyces cinnamoneus]PPT12095.1 hypothetical protein CYQ11_03560 [Streptomyces cinnamoneus]